MKVNVLITLPFMIFSVAHQFVDVFCFHAPDFCLKLAIVAPIVGLFALLAFSFVLLYEFSQLGSLCPSLVRHTTRP